MRSRSDVEQATRTASDLPVRLYNNLAEFADFAQGDFSDEALDHRLDLLLKLHDDYQAAAAQAAGGKKTD